MSHAFIESAFSFMATDRSECVDVQPLENNDAIAKTQILDQACQQLSTIAHTWTRHALLSI